MPLFGRKVKPEPPTCDVCGMLADGVTQFGALCDACANRGIYHAAYAAAGLPTPDVRPQYPRPPRLSQDPSA